MGKRSLVLGIQRLFQQAENLLAERRKREEELSGCELTDAASSDRGKRRRGRPGPPEINDRTFHQPGTILGKALEALPSGEGEILVLHSLQ